MGPKNEYPSNPPVITFLSEIDHWNIDSHGRWAMEDWWSPDMHIAPALLFIQSSLIEPEPEEPPQNATKSSSKRGKKKGKNAKKETSEQAHQNDDDKLKLLHELKVSLNQAKQDGDDSKKSKLTELIAQCKQANSENEDEITLVEVLFASLKETSASSSGQSL